MPPLARDCASRAISLRNWLSYCSTDSNRCRNFFRGDVAIGRTIRSAHIFTRRPADVSGTDLASRQCRTSRFGREGLEGRGARQLDALAFLTGLGFFERQFTRTAQEGGGWFSN